MENKDTRYFIDIDLKTHKVVGKGYKQKQNLDKGQQTNPERHRLFLSKGQYNQFTKRCILDLEQTS